MLIDGFNVACKNIDASYLKVGGESMSVILFGQQKKGTYLTCPIFSASQIHWGNISIKLPVMLQGPCYSLNSKEGRKG